VFPNGFHMVKSIGFFISPTGTLSNTCRVKKDSVTAVEQGDIIMLCPRSILQSSRTCLCRAGDPKPNWGYPRCCRISILFLTAGRPNYCRWIGARFLPASYACLPARVGKSPPSLPQPCGSSKYVGDVSKS
jgi:hypothetical protein